MAAPQAVQCERVRACFEHCKASSCVPDLRKKSLQVNRFWSGVGGGIFAKRRVIRDRPEETCLRAGGFDDGIDERSSRGFPVRSGHGHQLQRLRRMPEKICRGNGERFSRLAHLNPHHACRNRGWSCLLADDGHSAARNSVANERVPIRLRTMQSKKERARLYFAGIAGDLPNFQILRGRRKACFRAMQQFAQFHAPNGDARRRRIFPAFLGVVRSRVACFVFDMAQSSSHPNSCATGGASNSSRVVSRTRSEERCVGKECRSRWSAYY